MGTQGGGSHDSLANFSNRVLKLSRDLGGPGLYTFKVSDFGFGGRWSPLPDDTEDPRLMAYDLASAARVLIDVANGRAGASVEDHAFDAVPERFRQPIHRALDRNLDFAHERPALELLDLLTQA